MRLNIVTEPTDLAIPLSRVKEYLRIPADYDSDDGLLREVIIPTATRKLERAIGRAFVSQVWDVTYEEIPEDGYLWLPFAPVITLTSVKYYDHSGNESTWSSSTGYDSDLVGGRVIPKFGVPWPTSLRSWSAMIVRATFGYGTDHTFTPEAIKNSICFLSNFLYENRGEEIPKNTVIEAVNICSVYNRALRFVLQ